MFQGKAGWWIAGLCAVVVSVSMGYGMGRRSALKAAASTSSLEPAGAPLNSSIQIEPIQPQQELAAIGNSQNASAASASQTASQTTAPTAAAAQTASTKPDASADGIKQIQLALKAAGYDPGPADGQMGARTKTAIHDFQVANGLHADGKVGPRTWAKLQAVASNSSTTTTQ